MAFPKNLLAERRPTLLRQLHDYFWVGIAAALIDYGCLIILVHAGLNYILANTVSFSIANIFNFVAGHYVVFAGASRHDRLLSSYVYVLMISVLGLVINDVVLFLSVHILAMHILLGKTVATVVGFAWNFSARKRWVYR